MPLKKQAIDLLKQKRASPKKIDTSDEYTDIAGESTKYLFFGLF